MYECRIKTKIEGWKGILYLSSISPRCIPLNGELTDINSVYFILRFGTYLPRMRRQISNIDNYRLEKIMYLRFYLKPRVDFFS